MMKLNIILAPCLLLILSLFSLETSALTQAGCVFNICNSPSLAKCTTFWNGLILVSKQCLPCTSDSDCSVIGSGRKCVTLVSSRLLVVAKPSCTENPNQPQCQIVNGRAAYCAACTSSTQCSGSQICLNYECATCSKDLDCAQTFDDKIYCVSGACVACKSTSDCTDPTKPICSSGTCVGCTSSTDCTDPLNSLCSGGQCVPCSIDGDCHFTKEQYCSTAAGSRGCMECMPGHPCGSGTCMTALLPHYCRPVCSTSADCSGTAPFCGGSYLCQGCTDSFCTTEHSNYCGSDGACKNCLTNANCASPLSSYCDGTNNCAMCTSDDHCDQFTTTKQCKAGYGCVQCEVSSDCTTLTNSKCDTSSNTCVACTAHTDCNQFGDANLPYLCISNQCQISTGLILQLQATSESDTYLVKIPSDVLQGVNVNQALVVSLTGIDSSAYSYYYAKVTTTIYEIHFKVTQTIPPTQLQAIYTPYSIITKLASVQLTAQIATTQILYISEGQKAAATTMTSVAKAATTVMTASSGAVIAMGGNPIILWALLGLLQTFYYLIFINVNYPANVEIFLKVFSIGGLSFIPNPISWVVPNIEDYSLPTPETYEKYDIDGLFLNSAGSMLLVWAVVFGVYLVSAFGKKYFWPMSRLMTKVYCKVVQWFEWSGILRALITSYPELTQAALLQIRVMTFNSRISYVSSVLGIMFLAFGIAFPIGLFVLTLKVSKNPRRFQEKYTAIAEGFDLKGNSTAKHFNTILLLKRLLTNVCLVFLHTWPMFQVSCLILLGFGIFLLLLKHKPYESTASNRINLVTEVLMDIVHVLIFVLVYDDQQGNFSDQTRLNIGWGIIAACGTILMIALGTAFAEQIRLIIKIYKVLKIFLDHQKKSKTIKPHHKIKRRLDDSSMMSNRQHETLDISSQIINFNHNTTMHNFDTLPRPVPIQTLSAQRKRIVRPGRPLKNYN